MKNMKKIVAVLLAFAMVAAMGLSAFADADVLPDTEYHWAKEQIKRWTEEGIVVGYTDGNFHPEDVLTRAQAATIFTRLLKLTAQADVSQFTDVEADAWYTPYVARAVAKGIIKGMSATTMEPQSGVTREQFFVMLARALGLAPADTCVKSFNDDSLISSWAKGYIYALVNAGILSGYPDSTVLPQNVIKRSEVASILDSSIAVYATQDNATVVAEKGATGVVLVLADNVTVTAEEEGQKVDVVVAQDDANVNVETEGTVTVSAENTTLNVSAPNDVSVNAENTTIAATTEGVNVGVNQEGANVSLEGSTAPVDVEANENGTSVSNAPSGSTVTAGEGVNDTSLNNTQVPEGNTGEVKPDTTVEVGETPSEPDQPSEPDTPFVPTHTHSFSAEPGWYQTTVSGVAVMEYGYICTYDNYISPANATVVLEEDLSFDAPIYVANGQQMTLNLNGHNIIAEGHDAIYNNGTLTLTSNGFSIPEFELDDDSNLLLKADTMNGFVIVNNGSASAEESNRNGVINWGNLIVEYVGVAVADTYGSAIVNSGEGKTEVQQAMLVNTGLGNAVYANSGEVTLNDYTIAWGSTYGYAVFAYNESVVNVNGGFYYSTVGFPFCVAGGTLNLNGDAYTQVRPYTGTTEEDYAAYLAAAKEEYQAYVGKVEADGATGEVYLLGGTLKVANPADTDLDVVVFMELEEGADIETEKWSSQIWHALGWHVGDAEYYELDIRAYPDYVKDESKMMYKTDAEITIGGVTYPGTYGQLTELVPYEAPAQE